MLPIILFLSTALAGIPDCNGNGIDDSVDIAGIAPIAYWRFEEGNGPYLDSGPNALHGIPTNAASIMDVPVDPVPRSVQDNLLACLLDGNGYVTVPDTQGLLTFAGASFTVEAWVRVDELSDATGPSQRQFLLQKKEIASPGESQDYSILVQGGNIFQSVSVNFGKSSGYSGRELVLLFGNGNTVWSTTSFLQIGTTGWHHVSIAFDGTTGNVRFGLDGVFETIATSGPGHLANNGPLLIGAHTNASGVYNQLLRGAVDELRIAGDFLPVEELLLSFAWADCNRNGVPDECDIAQGVSADCDGNGQPDECQLIGNDCNGNGIPDQCDPDCNDNGVPDECDIMSGMSMDCQFDGIPDECQLGQSLDLFYDSGIVRIAWRGDQEHMAWLNRFNVVDGAGTVEGIEVRFGIIPLGTQVTVYVWTDPNGDGNPNDAQVLWSDVVTVLQTDTLSRIEVPNIHVGDTGASFFVGFIMPVTTNQMFPAALDIEGVPGPKRSWGITSSTPFDPNDLATGAGEFGTINDLLFGNQWVIRALMRGDGNDCNGNGIPDDCDIVAGASEDLDGNGIPDECDDCNNNGVLDSFDITAGTSIDCNGDGVPDECQTAANDCNGDGVPDDCQLAGNDCNGNGIPDDCDIIAGTSEDLDGNGVPDECEDCNGNGVLDSLDITAGTSIDCNGDGVPDECQFGEAVTSFTYAHDDGVQEGNLCFVGGGNLEFAWMNHFVVQPGGEWVSAIEVVWGFTFPDLPAKVVLWSDPNNDGNPADAQVLIAVNTRTMKIDSPSDNLNVIPIPPTFVGTAGGSFFVGVYFDDIYNTGCFIALDQSAPVSGQSWYAYNTAGSLDLNNLSGSVLGNWTPSDFLVRAVGFDGTLEDDCNGNGVLDICDISAGISDDSNANGTPDECECIGDLNGDGVIDFVDLLGVLAMWGECAACSEDLDGSGNVDFNDLLLLLAAWGSC